MENNTIIRKVKYIKCECCKRRIKKYGTRKWCLNCAAYIAPLQKQLYTYRLKYETLCYKIFHAPNEVERVRLK